LQESYLLLVYVIDHDFVLRDVLRDIGIEENISGNISMGIVSEQGPLVFPEETPVPPLGLASENLGTYFPWWQLVLFDTTGKTVEDIIGREKLLYGGALLGVFALILGGAGLTLRAAVHEAEAARIKSEFVSNVSHELKTPLALIRLFGETLELEDIQDKKKRQKFSRIITRESQRLSHLVENVLDFSRIDAGRKEYNFEEADIVQVVFHTIEAYRYYLKDQDFEFVTSIPEKPILMWIDKDSISQALLNLVSNAEKFSKERKYIGVKMVRKEGEVWIDVEDRGPGIPASSIKQIFEKFDRGVRDIASEVQGSGLGLTITKHIIESHGGRIDVESEMGEGSHFILKLPLKREKA
jgi:signal transduction histidine kinase